jgi:PIN domain nuclease of toxin-antitoxin system
MLTRCDPRSRRFARIALVDTHEIVLAAQQLPLSHRDPADRFLAATAQVMDLTLVTSDDNLLGLGTIRTMKN